MWPSAKDGKIVLTATQLAMLPEGTDWHLPQRSWTPLEAG
ncbi:MAG: transposase [Paracoccaceae bacterium]|jgi:transposase